jgi:pSer/pThr/pTyr-binding forkhead associated (FHA) protein
MGLPSMQLRFLTTRVPLRGEESVIGRSDYCSIVIAHASVSRLHACITLQAGRMYIRDLGSRNGTFVNGTRVGTTPSPVGLNDAVRIGSVECMLEEAAEHALSTADLGGLGVGSPRVASSNPPPGSDHD